MNRCVAEIFECRSQSPTDTADSIDNKLDGRAQAAWTRCPDGRGTNDGLSEKGVTLQLIGDITHEHSDAARIGGTSAEDFEAAA
jgi:hypothetical protein